MNDISLLGPIQKDILSYNPLALNSICPWAFLFTCVRQWSFLRTRVSWVLEITFYQYTESAVTGREGRERYMCLIYRDMLTLGAIWKSWWHVEGFTLCWVRVTQKGRHVVDWARLGRILNLPHEYDIYFLFSSYLHVPIMLLGLAISPSYHLSPLLRCFLITFFISLAVLGRVEPFCRSMIDLSIPPSVNPFSHLLYRYSSIKTFYKKRIYLDMRLHAKFSQLKGDFHNMIARNIFQDIKYNCKVIYNVVILQQCVVK